VTKPELVAFLRRHKYAVQASVSAAGAPQAAVVGVAVSDQLELFFDTLASTRKCQNLRRDPRISFVIGWDEEQTVQYEGLADEPAGDELARLKAAYFARFPDGPAREAWPDITYFRTRPTWIRYSDFGSAGRVVELGPAELGSDAAPAVSGRR
jgi:general stress protein 26